MLPEAERRTTRTFREHLQLVGLEARRRSRIRAERRTSTVHEQGGKPSLVEEVARAFDTRYWDAPVRLK